ncbi:MAG: hypothetical protein JW996_06125, partial [Candidatus Cloacimonetes bacterium]|nr:hypothetical protein [Candidatus Cloacimonadota bacterium]
EKPESSFDRARFKKLLSEFGGINGFVACSIFDPGGEEIVSYGTDPDSIAFRAASALTELFSYCSQATEVIGMNKAGELILQTNHSTIIMDSLDTDAFGRYLLMLILDKKGNMALTKLALKKILPELRKECEKS